MNQATQKMPDTASAPKLRKIRKLILTEDDEGYAVLLQRLFERADIKCELIWFPHGIKLLEYAKQERIGDDTLILLDLNLPVMSGFEILEVLRAGYSIEELPVIVISTTIRERESQKCLELGANSFLKKPVSYNDLLSTLGKMGMEF
jgi:DNA-binding response OmpR family regulator